MLEYLHHLNQFLQLNQCEVHEVVSDCGLPHSKLVITQGCWGHCADEVGCIVRNFVDEDPGPGAKDWHCGRLAYDGHKGTDIRVPDGVAMDKGVQVLAAAPGTVLRLRDGMSDVSIRETGADAVKDRDNVATKMTPAQIEQAKALVAAWKPKTGQ